MRRRRFMAGTAALPVAWPGALRAQAAFPARAVRIVVPNAPGGGADLTARAVGERMARTLGEPVVIENRAGAGGVVAGQAVASAAPDGHTLLLISSGTAVSQALFKSLPFDALTAFAPVGLMAQFDLVVVSAENGPFKRLADMLAFARREPGKLNLGTPSIGTTQHLAAEWLVAAAGLSAQVVPFKGTPDVITAVRSGQLHAGLDILSPLLAQIQGRALRPLAVTGARRSSVLPDVPTAQEAGVAGLDATSWNGLAARAGTPPDVVQRLNEALNAALADADVRRRLQTLNLEPCPGTPQDAAERLSGDVMRWAEVIARARIERQ
ncbi:MAG: tripartite tricarboxylate transporter substrate-binding protein [Pseudomonadota bacterium]|nr:tripartite tricarboxylate transporter substrate-binding protein [Pseudomonadota bacterium]